MPRSPVLRDRFGGNWWLLKTVLCVRGLTSGYHSLISLSRRTVLRRGTKTGQKRRKIKSRSFALTVLTRTIIFVDANIIICPESAKSFPPYILTLNNFSDRGRYIYIFQNHLDINTVDSIILLIENQLYEYQKTVPIL